MQAHRNAEIKWNTSWWLCAVEKIRGKMCSTRVSSLKENPADHCVMMQTDVCLLWTKYVGSTCLSFSYLMCVFFFSIQISLLRIFILVFIYVFICCRQCNVWLYGSYWFTLSTIMGCTVLYHPCIPSIVALLRTRLTMKNIISMLGVIITTKFNKTFSNAIIFRCYIDSQVPVNISEMLQHEFTIIGSWNNHLRCAHSEM